MGIWKKWLHVSLVFVLTFSLLAPAAVQAEELDVTNDEQAISEVGATTPDSAGVSISKPTKEELLNNLSPSLDEAIETAKDYVVGKTPASKFSNEWGILLLARGGYDNQEYFDTYLTNIDAYMTEKSGNVGSSTNHSRLVIGLSAVGKDSTDVNGYNLLNNLADFSITGKSLNGAIYGLIALDTYAYDIPQAEVTTLTTREKLIEAILAKEIAGGGFAFSGTTPEIDMTAMALQSLAPYKDQPEVAAVIDRGLAILADRQQETGGFISYGAESVESAAQVLVALSALGIDAAEDERFVKDNGAWIVSNMMEFASETGFKRTKAGTKDDNMSTQQAGYALVAYDRFLKGKNSLYDMTDVKPAEIVTPVDPSAPEETPEGDVTLTEYTVAMSITGPDAQVILPSEQFNITADETAYSLLKRITLQKQIDVDDRTTDMGAYIAGIAGVSEFDHGATSGWMYLVNGQAVQVAANEYIVQPNDVIEWRYTKNLGEDVTDGITVSVRVEGFDKTILPKQEIQLTAYDISAVVENSNVSTTGTPYAIHAILKAFEQAGHDVTTKEKFDVGVDNYGVYISKLAGLSATDTGGWMFAVNNTSPSEGVGSYALQNQDEIVVYFVEDWTATNYSYLQLSAIENNAYKVQLLSLGYDDNWNTITIPVSDAIIVIDGEESAYKTDANGYATIQFTTEGKHELTAVKKAGDSSVISRPYLAIDVQVGMVVEPTPTPAEPEPTPVEPTEPTTPVVPPSAVTPLVEKTTSYLQTKVPTATFGSEWAIVALARSHVDVPQSYYDNYLASVGQALKELSGVLEGPRTEHSRLILALSAIGVDAKNVGGYNVFAPLHDFDKVTSQGLNGAIFALLAFDAQNYNPAIAHVNRVASLTDVAATTTTTTTREKLVDYIVENELAGGGFALSGNAADPDITAMALQALAPYQADLDVAPVINRGIAKLSSIQLNNAGYTSAGNENVQSAAQVLIALSTLKIDAATDTRFIKEGKTILDNIGSYSIGDGGYKHPKNGAYNAMATQQVTQALVAYDRFAKGLPSLFAMADVTVEETPIPTPAPTTPGAGGGAVTPVPVPTKQVAYITITNKSYGDILAETEVKLNKGETVFSILKRITNQKGISLTSRSSSYGKYITGIDGVSEFDRGPQSGWMYSVNGSFPSYSSDTYDVDAGDYIEWVYTEDLGKDVGGYVDGIETKPVVTPPTTTPATQGGGGGAKPQTATEKPQVEKGSQLKATISSEVIQAHGAENAAPLVLQNDTGKKLELPATLLQSITLAADEVLYVAVSENDSKQIQVSLDVKDAQGKTAPIVAGKDYVKVVLPAEKVTENTVVLQLVDGELKAVPHKIVNNEIVLFVKTSGTFIVREESVTFKDIENSTHKADIEFLASRHVIKGKNAETFGPNDAITRAQFASLVSRALSLQANEPGRFADTQGKWFESDVQALFEAGITTGKTATTFDPFAEMTREQGAAFMARILAYAGYEGTSTAALTFTDAEKINDDYTENIALLVSLGIMSGKSDGSFDPKGNLTRGQLAKMLTRTLNVAGLM